MKTEKLQLDTDEHVLLQIRKHWFVLCMNVVSILIVAILPLPFFIIIARSGILPEFITFNTAFLIALYTGWLIIQWMILFSAWTNYYLDVWVVTNKRLIAVDQRGFFSRKMASFRLERMQDITVSVNGILATFLDYGTLEIQTAGEEGEFKVSGMPSPIEIKSIILSAAGELSSKGTTQPQAEV